MNKKIKVLYCIPSLDTVYTEKIIYYGYKNAFVDIEY